MNRLLATLLAASLAVNLWLGWKWAATSASKEISSHGPAALARPFSSGAASTPSVWRALTDYEPAELRQQLDTEGVSREMTRAILRVRLREKYRAEWEASTVAGPDRADWWRIALVTPEKEARRNARSKLNARIEAELDALLGEKKSVRNDDARYWFLSPEKADAVREVLTDYKSLQLAYARDSSKLAVLDAEQRRDLAEILSPEELAEYELRFAPHVDQLRFRAAQADVSEAEFRQLIGLERHFESSAQNAKSFAARAVIETDYVETLFRLLGAERAPDYLWGADEVYSSARLALRGQQLPVQPAVDLIQLRNDISGRAATIAFSGDAAEAKRTALSALAAEARIQLARLTPPGFLFPSNTIAWIDELDRGAVSHRSTIDTTSWATRIGP